MRRNIEIRLMLCSGSVLPHLLIIILLGVILGGYVVPTYYVNEQLDFYSSNGYGWESIDSFPIETELEQLRDSYGKVAYHDTMNLYEQQKVFFILGMDDLIELLEAQPETPFHDKIVRIKVSDRMIATLNSHDFEINNLGEKIQAVREKGLTAWSWSIKPKSHGPKKLAVTVSALIDVAGKETPDKIETYTENIYVEVTPTQHGMLLIKEWWPYVAGSLAGIWALLTWRSNARQRTS